jgi:carbon-monoxide dehydrogenase catalytic subunit
MAGFDTHSIIDAFGGRGNMVRLMREGEIRGIATMVSCNTPKVIYEHNNVNLARELAKRKILITTTGCASHALLCDGLADPAVSSELNIVGNSHGIPPVLPVGECVDNTRTMFLFMELADEAGVPLHEMPFYYIGGEPGNEKALGMAVGFLVHGISVLTGYPIPIPVPAVRPNAVSGFFGAEALQVLGARMFVQSDPFKAVEAIHEDMTRKREALGWTN